MTSEGINKLATSALDSSTISLLWVTFIQMGMCECCYCFIQLMFNVRMLVCTIGCMGVVVIY